VESRAGPCVLLILCHILHFTFEMTSLILAITDSRSPGVRIILLAVYMSMKMCGVVRKWWYGQWAAVRDKRRQPSSRY
jgi:hypothetical protein